MVLFLDEFRSSFKISEILDYLDGQPIRIRGRNYNRVACYDTVYIVSNIPLTEQYKNIQDNEPKTWAAFLRRITAVYNFDISKETPVNKHTGEKAAFAHTYRRRQRLAVLTAYRVGCSWVEHRKSRRLNALCFFLTGMRKARDTVHENLFRFRVFKL